MTNDDRPAFGSAMHALGHTFDTEVTAIRVEAYFDALADYSLEQVHAAMREAIKTCRFFPRPVEIRDLLTGSTVEAWGEVLRELRRVGSYGQPDFSNPAILPAIRAIAGSWPDFCRCNIRPEAGQEALAWHKRFSDAFTICADRDQRTAALPPHLADAMRALAEQKSFPPAKKIQ